MLMTSPQLYYYTCMAAESAVDTLLDPDKESPHYLKAEESSFAEWPCGVALPQKKRGEKRVRIPDPTDPESKRAFDSSDIPSTTSTYFIHAYDALGLHEDFE
eukprot:gene7566-377_t